MYMPTQKSCTRHFHGKIWHMIMYMPTQKSCIRSWPILYSLYSPTCTATRGVTFTCTATRGVLFTCTATRGVPFTCTATHSVHCYTWCAIYLHCYTWCAVYLHCYAWCALLHVVCTASHGAQLHVVCRLLALLHVVRTAACRVHCYMPHVLCASAAHGCHTPGAQHSSSRPCVSWS